MPQGFRVGVDTFEFIPEELGETATEKARMTLSLLVPDQPIPADHFAAVFTKNTFPGAPVKIGRKLLQSRASIGAVVVNTKISNVHPKGGGVQAAEEICAEVHSLLGLAPNASVIPSSTGIIGFSLPVAAMKAALPAAVGKLTDGQTMFDFARGIMTTDKYPKVRTFAMKDPASGEKIATITGVAKGAGMIEPDMATMLVYVATDARADRLQERLEEAVNVPGSFNSISVDSDQSTSDTVLLLSSGKVERPEHVGEDEWLQMFQDGVNQVCKELAHDVVRNGEGVTHVIEVLVKGAPSMEVAKGTGKALVNSPLVKCAVAGDDPNVGRILMAMGDYFSTTGPEIAQEISNKMSIALGDVVVFKDGEFVLDPTNEAVLSAFMQKYRQSVYDGFPTHNKALPITIDLGFPNGSEAVILGADLSADYVKANVDYRS